MPSTAAGNGLSQGFYTKNTATYQHSSWKPPVLEPAQQLETASFRELPPEVEQLRAVAEQVTLLLLHGI